MVYLTQSHPVPIDIIRGINKALKVKDRGTNDKDNEPEFTPAEELIGIAVESHDVLMTCDTVFPFTLFPDTISVDRQKLTIIHRNFFRMADIVSVQIGDVLNVEAHVGPFFGSLRISSKYFIDNHQEINFLTRTDAIEIQRLLQGYVIAHQRDIDCTNIDKDQLIILLHDLGQGAKAVS